MIGIPSSASAALPLAGPTSLGIHRFKSNPVAFSPAIARMGLFIMRPDAHDSPRESPNFPSHRRPGAPAMAERTPLVVFGAAGRMGRTILACADPATQPFDLVAAVEHAGNPCVGRPVTELLPSAPPEMTVTADLPTFTPPGTVAINFSSPEATLAQLDWAQTTGTATVVGTTGFDGAQQARVAAIAKHIPLLLAPNMSVGVNVLYRLVAEAVKLLGEDYDIEITEMHHRFKKDAPSGTARALLATVLEAQGRKPGEAQVLHGREGLPGERTAGEMSSAITPSCSPPSASASS
jgi:4-hydroxy-tetrahydrodipicolinate reductase